MATLPRGDGHAWPAFAGGLIGRKRHGQVLDIRYMLDNASRRKGKCGRGRVRGASPRADEQEEVPNTKARAQGGSTSEGDLFALGNLLALNQPIWFLHQDEGIGFCKRWDMESDSLTVVWRPR